MGSEFGQFRECACRRGSFQLWHPAVVDVVCAIGCSASRGGIRWTKYPGNSCLGWLFRPLGLHPPNPSVMKDGAACRMWFSSGDRTSIWIDNATSMDGLRRTQHPRECSSRCQSYGSSSEHSCGHP